MTITENTIMKDYREEPIGSGWRIDFTSARDRADQAGALRRGIARRGRRGELRHPVVR